VPGFVDAKRGHRGVGRGAAAPVFDHGLGRTATSGHCSVAGGGRPRRGYGASGAVVDVLASKSIVGEVTGRVAARWCAESIRRQASAPPRGWLEEVRLERPELVEVRRVEFGLPFWPETTAGGRGGRADPKGSENGWLACSTPIVKAPSRPRQGSVAVRAASWKVSAVRTSIGRTARRPGRRGPSGPDTMHQEDEQQIAGIGGTFDPASARRKRLGESWPT